MKKRFPLTLLPLTAYLFPLYLLPLFLFSCGSKHYEKSKEFSENGMDVKVFALSSKEVEAGITGAPHSPIIIPYVKSNKGLVITLVAGKCTPLVIESYSNMDSLVSKDELGELLDGISIKISSDKKHIAYHKHYKGPDVFLTIHLLHDSFPFMLPSKKQEFEAFSDLKGNPDEFVELVLGDKTLPDMYAISIWNAVGALPPGDPLHYAALTYWKNDNYARSLVANVSSVLYKKDAKWKAAVDKMIADYLRNFKEGGERSILDLDDGLKQMSELCYAIRDSALISRFHSYLLAHLNMLDCAKQFNYDKQYYASDTLTNVYALRMEKLFDHACVTKLNSSASTAMAYGFMEVFQQTGDSLLSIKCMNIFCSQWPNDSAARVGLNRYSFFIPKDKYKSLREKAITALNGAYAQDAENLLIAISTPEELKALHEKYGRSFLPQEQP